jgi:hypothetical protein
LPRSGSRVRVSFPAPDECGLGQPGRARGRHSLGIYAEDANLAGWQSGYAAACKAVYAGSIPTPASRLISNDYRSSTVLAELLWRHDSAIEECPARGARDVRGWSSLLAELAESRAVSNRVIDASLFSESR